jgi:hypothetical protein
VVYSTPALKRNEQAVVILTHPTKGNAMSAAMFAKNIRTECCSILCQNILSDGHECVNNHGQMLRLRLSSVGLFALGRKHDQFVFLYD